MDITYALIDHISTCSIKYSKEEIIKEKHKTSMHEHLTAWTTRKTD